MGVFPQIFRGSPKTKCLTICPKPTTRPPLKITGPSYWVREKLFAVPTPDPAPTSVQSQGPAYESAGESPFVILLPPPNVTGRLHMGHMLNQTEMDILTRWRRMSGRLALWVPGTDHAGIATQMMVERQLTEEGTSRQKLGREAFVERVWAWKRHYGGAILEQMKRLGVSVDWSREYFTMDERLSVAVREAFVRLYAQGLIYRGAYIVNWCPRCQTAISDLEVVHQEQKGHLWEIRYPVLGDGGKETGEFITVATTRPETMLGDTAVAIHPEDERYLHLHGKKLRLPLMNREIPIVVDPWVSREFGTGAVKVTPAHDPNDFAIGERHHLPSINVMDDRAHINENGGPYQGLDRYVARKKIVADLEAQGLLAGIKDYTNNVGHCDRCKTVVEPRLSTQWFIASKIQAGESGREGHRGRQVRCRWQQGHSLHAGELREDLPRVDGRIFTTGASRASSGGAIAFPRGTAASATRSRCRSPARRAIRPRAPTADRKRSRRKPTFSTRGSLRDCCRFLFSAGRTSRRRRAPISTRSIRPACSSPASTFSSSGWRA